MPGYRYQFVDLRTDQHIVDLPLTSVSFDRRICQAGSFSATLPITNSDLASLAARVVPRTPGDVSKGPGRTVVHVWRNGQIWGSYVIWAAKVSADARGRVSISFTGSGLESVLWRRLVGSVSYSNSDQLFIARDLVSRAQGTNGTAPRWLGLTFGGQSSSGVRRDRTYSSFDYAMVGERLQQLSEVINGPEWSIFTSANAIGARRREFRVSQVLGTGTVHRITQPGTLVDWSYTIDANSATTYHTIRGGDDGNGSRRYATRPANLSHLEKGWPWLDAVHDYPTATVASTLAEYADWWMDHRSGAIRVMTAAVQVPENPTLTPEHLGDVARMTVVNPWWPLSEEGEPTLDEARRIVGMEITPPERDSPERMGLVFEEPRVDGAAAAGYGEPIYPPTITDMLSSLPPRMRAMLTGSAPS